MVRDLTLRLVLGVSCLLNVAGIFFVVSASVQSWAADFLGLGLEQGTEQLRAGSALSQDNAGATAAKVQDAVRPPSNLGPGERGGANVSLEQKRITRETGPAPEAAKPLRSPRVQKGMNETVCEVANVWACPGFHCSQKLMTGIVAKAVSISRTPPISYDELVEDCLEEQVPRPGPVVRGPNNTVVEVTRLNAGVETRCGFLTPSGCPERWDTDNVGRPLNMPTSVYLVRAVKVNHPSTGMLNPSQPPPPRRCARPVPKIIHYIWVGPRALSKKLLVNLASAALTNPSWKVIVWLDRPPTKKERLYLGHHSVSSRPAGAPVFSFVHGLASQMRNWDIVHRLNSTSKPGTIGAALSDILRLELLYLIGGVYVDVDTRFYHGFDEYGSLFWWPWVTHKVCGVNIPNNAFGFDRQSGYLDFALTAFREACTQYRRCTPYAGAGPPFMAISILRYNSSDISMIGQQHFSASDSNLVSVMGHTNDKTWFMDQEDGDGDSPAEQSLLAR